MQVSEQTGWNRGRVMALLIAAATIATATSCARRLPVADEPLTAGAFSPGGRRFVTAGMDRLARVWDTTTGTLIHEFDDHLDGVTVTIFAGPERLITGSIDGRVRVWSLESGDLVALLELDEEVRDIDASGDSQLVAVALADGR